MGEKPESTELSPEDRRWLRGDNDFWAGRRGQNDPERREVLWFFAGLLLLLFGGLFSCPTRYT